MIDQLHCGMIDLTLQILSVPGCRYGILLSIRLLEWFDLSLVPLSLTHAHVLVLVGRLTLFFLLNLLVPHALEVVIQIHSHFSVDLHLHEVSE